MKIPIVWVRISIDLSDTDYSYKAKTKAEVSCNFPVPVNLDPQILGQLLQGYALVVLQDYNNKLLESDLEESNNDSDSE